MSVLAYYKPTPEGAAALLTAIDEAALRGTDVVVYNTPATDVVVDRTALDGAREAAAERGIAFTTPDLPDQHEPVDHLLTAAKSPDAHLVVIGVRHRSAVGKLLLGSVEQHILLDSPASVLAVKA
ncbi:universal stress protein [Rhodococcus opacus]|uniref:universal stress protein n=1 Tax=Rhodococcus opacus TaxID=37919 RepID=UPI001C45A989|nr:universal stress protein [Rhodococcus opacus]MBV6760388.1 universal stress protein [Rhodococcus opacus]